MASDFIGRGDAKIMEGASFGALNPDGVGAKNSGGGKMKPRVGAQNKQNWVAGHQLQKTEFGRRTLIHVFRLKVSMDPL